MYAESCWVCSFIVYIMFLQAMSITNLTNCKVCSIIHFFNKQIFSCNFSHLIVVVVINEKIVQKLCRFINFSKQTSMIKHNPNIGCYHNELTKWGLLFFRKLFLKFLVILFTIFLLVESHRQKLMSFLDLNATNSLATKWLNKET